MSKQIIFSNNNRAISREECADLLHNIADKIQNGSLEFEGSSLNLDFPESIDFEVEVKEKVKGSKHKRELELEISWDLNSSQKLGVK